MIGIKSKQDAVVAVVFIAFLLGFLYLVFFVSGWWILSAPAYGLVALFLSSWIGTGKVPKTPKEEGITVDTRILTVGGESKPCTVIVRTDRIIVKSIGNNTEIPMETLSTVMFEDKTTDGLSMAGFGIDYCDSDGPARVMFFNQGAFSVRRTHKIVALIQTTHQNWSQANNVNSLPVIDVSALKKQVADSVVHRLP
jgi:hypothetical protein